MPTAKGISLVRKGILAKFKKAATFSKEIQTLEALSVAEGDVLKIEQILQKGKTTGIQAIDDIVDDLLLDNLSKDIKYLPGPLLPEKIAATFEKSIYINRKLISNEKYFKYHGLNNRTGKKYTWVTNKKYTTEIELRKGLAIRNDWGVEITNITEFDVPASTWVSEGKAAAQGIGYPGGDYQGVILNIPKAWIIKTEKAFK